MLKIRIKYLTTDLLPVREISQGDWIDLRAARDIDIEKGETVVIPLGVAIQLPNGYEAIVAPRSSTFKHFGILMSNSIGVIDESYCGDDDEWHFPAFATRAAYIKKNDRICQFRIIEHQPAVRFETVLELGHDNRGGFGSTGKE